jgi:hypothetical protein
MKLKGILDFSLGNFLCRKRGLSRVCPTHSHIKKGVGVAPAPRPN